MSKRSDEIRDKYIKNPPEGMTADDIRHMSEDDLLDMDYFLNEDDPFDEDFPIKKKNDFWFTLDQKSSSNHPIQLLLQWSRGYYQSSSSSSNEN